RTVRVMVVSLSAAVMVRARELRALGVLFAEGFFHCGNELGVPVGSVIGIEGDAERRGGSAVVPLCCLGRMQLRVQHRREHVTECRQRIEKSSDALASECTQ